MLVVVDLAWCCRRASQGRKWLTCMRVEERARAADDGKGGCMHAESGRYWSGRRIAWSGRRDEVAVRSVSFAGRRGRLGAAVSGKDWHGMPRWTRCDENNVTWFPFQSQITLRHCRRVKSVGQASLSSAVRCVGVGARQRHHGHSESLPHHQARRTVGLEGAGPGLVQSGGTEERKRCASRVVQQEIRCACARGVGVREFCAANRGEPVAKRALERAGVAAVSRQ